MDAEAERAAGTIAAMREIPGICPLGVPLTLGELLEYEFPARETILSPWLSTQGLALVYARTGMGKTYFALSAALAVAFGGTYLTYEASQPRTVLYVDGELPGVVLQKRVKMLAAGMSDAEYLDNISFITPDAWQGPMPNLGDVDGQAVIEAAAEDSELIVLDNISTLIRSGKENAADDWSLVQEWALSMRRQNKTMLFVHHAGKGGAQRGTSKKEDVLDAVIELKRPNDYRYEEGARFEIHYNKSRGFYGDDARPMEAKLSEDGGGAGVWTYRTVEQANLDKVADLLDEGLAQTQICAELELSKGYVSRLAKEAKFKGLCK